MKKLICSIFAALLLLTPSVSAYDLENVGEVLFVGDSYCRGVNVNNDGEEDFSNGWAEKAANKLALIKYDVICKNGYGLIGAAEDRAFISLINQYAETHNNLDAVNWIVLSAGYNDANISYDDLIDAGNKLVERTRELFPNAHILISMNGWHATDADIQSKLRDNVLKAYSDLAANNEVYIMDSAQSVLVGHEDDAFSSDGLHPNVVGQEYIADGVADYIDRIFEVAYDSMPSDSYSVSNVQIFAPLAIVLGSILAVAITVRIRVFGAHK